jgi:tetratricopeptide (TPR) repeat protein
LQAFFKENPACRMLCIKVKYFLNMKILYCVVAMLLAMAGVLGSACAYTAMDGLSLASQGQWEEAERVFSGILEKNKKDNTASSAQGLLQDIKEGRVSPEYGKVLFAALVFVQKGAFDEALGALQRAIEIQPEYPKAYNIMGMVYSGKGDLPKAVEMFRQAVAKDGQYGKAYYNLGVALQAQGNIDEAIEQLKKAAQRDPSPFDAYLGIGTLYASREEYAQALPYLEKAFSLNAQNAAVCYQLGMVHFMADNYVKSREFFTKARQLFEAQDNTDGVQAVDKYLQKFLELEKRWRSGK